MQGMRTLKQFIGSLVRSIAIMDRVVSYTSNMLFYNISRPRLFLSPNCSLSSFFRVFASCIIDEAGVVTTAGPTYISIRSAKHDRTNLDCEEIDFEIISEKSNQSLL